MLQEFFINHTISAIFALIGILGGISLLLTAVLFIYFRFTNRIAETKDFAEHIMLGSLSLFLGITVYLTDFQHGLSNWIHHMTHKSTAMPVQYLFMGLLYFKLIHHLYKQHIK